MKPWLRNTLIGAAALIVLLVIGAAVLVSTFDANRLKALAIETMKNDYQRTLTIDGPIELSLFPRIAVRVSKVRLSERGRADQFLAIDEAALAVRTWPLLRKQLVVDRVSARGVRAAYLRDANGRSNIDDLIGGSAAEAGKPAASAPSSGTAPRFDISAITLDDVALTVRDAMMPLDGRITVKSLHTGRLANQGETPLSLRASIELTKPQPLRFAIDGSTTLALDLDKHAVRVSDMKLDVQLDGAGLKGIALAATGAAGWDGALRVGPLKLEVKRGERGALVLSPSSLEVKQLLFDRASQKLDLDALKLHAAGRQGAAPFELSLDWPRLAVDAQSLKGSALSGSAKLGDETALTATFRSGAPSGKFDALRLPGLVLALQGQMQRRKIDGTLKADLLLDAGKGALAIDGLDLKATLVDPGLQPLQLAARGHARAQAKAASWQIDGALNANKFDIDGQAAFGGKVPTIAAQARFDSLDLNKLLAPDKPDKPGAGAPAPAPADIPVALDALNALDGKFNLSAGSFAFRQYKVSDLKADATLNAGVLRIARLTGRAWSGVVNLSGSADATTRRVALKANADGVNVNALLKDVAGKDLLEGTGRVVADVTTSGATVGAMRRSLAGAVALRITDGAIKGVNLARRLRQAKAALGRQDTSSAADVAEKTDFSELSASARIVDGVAQSDDLDVKSPFLRIGGAGRFDIGRGTIDYTARATVVESATGQGGADLAALKGVTVPVHLSGPFDAITWQIQWSGVAAKAIENQLKRKLEQRLGLTPVPAGGAASAAPGAQQAPRSDKDKLRDELKRLLGR
ncbi:MAG TPA: AsmA family protein [Burkholderiaceae bacterium]|nr:AsmA family protein [Burkholderiaceae bacterium]